jgi:hypothetical protein
MQIKIFGQWKKVLSIQFLGDQSVMVFYEEHGLSRFIHYGMTEWSKVEILLNGSSLN